MIISANSKGNTGGSLPLTGNVSLQVNNQPLDKIFTVYKKPVYYVESAIIASTSIEVDYTLNDDWMTASVDIRAVQAFVVKTGLNEYCFDDSNHAGEHVQEAGTLELDIYLEENLDFVIKAYFEAERIGQYYVN